VQKKTPCVAINKLSVSFQGTKALDSLDVSIMPFEHTVFMGPNGSGKSTLLRVIAGELFPDSDGGTRVWHTPEGETTSPIIARQYISLVSYGQLERYLQQRWNLTGELLIVTGYYNTPLLYQEPTEIQRQEVQALATRLGLEDLLSRPIVSLRPAQLSMLLLARACITKPAMLLLDEFTDNLVDADHACVLAMLMELCQTTTLLAASHRTDTLPPCFTRKLLMEDGRFVGASTAHVVRASPDLSVEFMKEDLPNALSEVPLLFDIQNACVRIDETAVLFDLSWRMHHGEQWLIVGGHGSGKSSFLRLIMGELCAALGGSITRYHAPDKPKSLVDSGECVTGTQMVLREEICRAIHFVSATLQATYAYVVTGAELVASGIDNTIGLYRVITNAEWEQVHAWMQRFKVEHLANRTLDAMSTGQKRRLMLARALIGSPTVVLCDEPFTGLDAAARESLQALFIEHMQAGTHFIISVRDAHDLPTSFTHALVLDKGRIVQQGPITR